MSTTALLVSIAVVITVGIFHLYDVLLRLLSKTRVQNKVVLITDSLSVLGHGILLFISFLNSDVEVTIFCRSENFTFLNFIYFRLCQMFSQTWGSVDSLWKGVGKA